MSNRKAKSKARPRQSGNNTTPNPMSGRPEVVTVEMEDRSATVKVTTQMWTTATDSAKKTLKKHWNGYSTDEQVGLILDFLVPIAKLEAERREKEAERREKEAERREKEAAKADLAARDAAGSLWKNVVEKSGTVFPAGSESKPEGAESYYASPVTVAGAPFYEMFHSDAALQLLNQPKVTPNEWISIDRGLYGKPLHGPLPVMLNEADVATNVARLGKTCCAEVVNRAFGAKDDYVFFHNEYILGVTSSRGVKSARKTPGLRPDVVGGHHMRKAVEFRFVGENKHIEVYTLGDEPIDLVALYNSRASREDKTRGAVARVKKARVAMARVEKTREALKHAVGSGAKRNARHEASKVKKRARNVASKLSEAAAAAKVESVKCEAVRYPVDQLYTYMCVMLLKYGFLSTYNTWWFCKREYDTEVVDGEEYIVGERLVISEPITAESSGPTLTEALALFVSISVLDNEAVGMEAPREVVERVCRRYEAYPTNEALDADIEKMTNHFRDAVKNERNRQSKSSLSEGGTKCDTDMQSAPSDVEPPSVHVWPSLPLAELPGEPEYLRELGRGRSGISFEAKIDKFPLPVAVKIADLSKMDTAEEELKHERRAYLRMMKLWGTVVPFFAWCGRMPWGRAGLATTLAGKRTLEQHLKQRMPVDMPALERKLSDGLDEIHACGLAHGDIEMRNIVVDDDGEGGLEAKFIDFGSSSFLDDDRRNALHVHQEQERDRVYLRNMLTTAEAWTAK